MLYIFLKATQYLKLEIDRDTREIRVGTKQTNFELRPAEHAKMGKYKSIYDSAEEEAEYMSLSWSKFEKRLIKDFAMHGYKLINKK